MSAIYSYSKSEGVHMLRNTSENSISYSVLKDTSPLTYISGNIPKNGFVLLPLLRDGIYKVTVTGVVVTLGAENEVTQTFTITNHDALLESFISDTEKVLCGCKECNECEDCDSCQEMLTAIITGNSYKALARATYSTYYETVLGFYSNEISAETVCMVTTGLVTGNKEVNGLAKKLIAFLYLTFYYKDLSLAHGEDGKAYVNKFYKTKNILKCLGKLGLPHHSTIFK